MGPMGNVSLSYIVLQVIGWRPGVVNETVDGLCWYQAMIFAGTTMTLYLDSER